MQVGGRARRFIRRREGPPTESGGELQVARLRRAFYLMGDFCCYLEVVWYYGYVVWCSGLGPGPSCEAGLECGGFLCVRLSLF